MHDSLPKNQNDDWMTMSFLTTPIWCALPLMPVSKSCNGYRCPESALFRVRNQFQTTENELFVGFNNMIMQRLLPLPVLLKIL
jgi:hypothetical protein